MEVYKGVCVDCLVVKRMNVVLLEVQASIPTLYMLSKAIISYSVNTYGQTYLSTYDIVSDTAPLPSEHLVLPHQPSWPLTARDGMNKLPQSGFAPKIRMFLTTCITQCAVGL